MPMNLKSAAEVLVIKSAWNIEERKVNEWITSVPALCSEGNVALNAKCETVLVSYIYAEKECFVHIIK